MFGGLRPWRCSLPAQVNVDGGCAEGRSGFSYRVDLIQVISTLASSQGTSISTPGAQIGFIPTETALPCLVCAPRPFFF